MSDQAQPGWWQASDGKWYPPEAAPGGAPTPPPPPVWGAPPPPPPSGMSGGAKVAIGVVVGLVAVLVVAVLAIALLGEDSETSFSSTGSVIDGGPVEGEDDDGADEESDDGGGSSEAADVPDGFVLVEGDGVSVALPEGWTAVSPDEVALSDEELADLFPDLDPSTIDNAGEMFAQGAVLFAVDQGSTTFADNVNVLSLPGEVPPAALETQVRSQLETLGGSVTEVEQVDLPAGPALRAVYEGSAGGQAFHGVQLYVSTGGRTYVITYSTGEPQAEVAAVIEDTFRVE